MNTQLIVGLGGKTMSTVELVDVINTMREDGKVELRHDNFMVKVEKHPGIDALKFKAIYLDSMNREKPCYHLPYREASLMVMSESLEVQTKVFDRLTEATAAFNLPTTLAAALRMAAEQLDINAAQVQQMEAARLQIAADRPAVEFVDKYVEATGSKSFRQVCKVLRAKENVFRAFLEIKKIMYRLGGEWMPAAQHLDAGRFVVKAGKSEVSSHAFNSARFTPKGLTWIAGEYAKFQLEVQENINV